jgi:hypothetical protein
VRRAGYQHDGLLSRSRMSSPHANGTKNHVNNVEFIMARIG